MQNFLYSYSLVYSKIQFIIFFNQLLIKSGQQEKNITIFLCNLLLK